MKKFDKKQVDKYVYDVAMKGEEMKLGELVYDDGLYFEYEEKIFVTKGNGWSAGGVGIENCETGEWRWEDPLLYVKPLTKKAALQAIEERGADPSVSPNVV